MTAVAYRQRVPLSISPHSTGYCTTRSSPPGVACCAPARSSVERRSWRFEDEFAAVCEARHCVAVSTGTDALVLALRALGIGPGDRVIVPANTFFASAEAVSLTGAEPALVDCDPQTRTISVEAVARELRAGGAAGVIAVHLYGHPADMSKRSPLSPPRSARG